LSINPCKTAVLASSKKITLKGFKEPTIFGKTIKLSTEVKYLGLSLGKGMSWGSWLDKFTKRAY
jgi:hypothetical protein